MPSEYSSSSAVQFKTISYRNGIYQGMFDNKQQVRHNFGLIFTTDNHMIMGSNWVDDKPNQATFIYYNHSHYMYGFWFNGMVNGFNAVRFDKVVIYGWYEFGTIKGRLLIVYEQYNTAVVLQVGQNQQQFVEVQKGDIFSDEHFNEYIRMCKWPSFEQNWKTLIKFMSSNLIQQKQSKNASPKLRLVNQTYYRYGFDEGIAIVFDDQYKIISVGLHKKANLKSLGVKFTKQNFIEQGNFDTSNQIYAFNYGHRPEVKIGKIYNNYLLKSVDFINKYLSNPAKILINYLEELIKSNLFRKMLAGQITTRKLDMSFESPARSKTENNKLQSSKKTNDPKKYQQQKKRLKQEKVRLENYRKQIYQSINKKTKGEQNYKEIQPTAENQKAQKIITKPPVQIATRTNRYHQKVQPSSNKNNRSPIFTPDRTEKNENNQSPVVPTSNVSPFQQRIRSKIFKDNEGRRSNKKYLYTPIQDELYPKHTENVENNNNNKNYNSPHQELNFSRSRVKNNNQYVVPISVRNQMLQRIRQGAKKQKKKNQQILIQQQPKKDGPTEKMKRQNRQNKQEVDNNKKVIRNSEKIQPMMSFRNPYLDYQPKKQYSNTNMANIVIASPIKNKSPMKKLVTQPDLSDNRDGMNRKNNVYFKQSITVPQFSPNQKLKKEIKGNTYLQKYKKSKNQTPQKVQPDLSQSKKYNKTIKSFNNNNRIYQKIQSPPKKTPQKKSNKSIYLQEIPNSARRTTEIVQPRKTNEIVQPKKTPQKKANKSVYLQEYPNSARKTTEVADPKKYNEMAQTISSKKKYQYVFN